MIAKGTIATKLGGNGGTAPQASMMKQRLNELNKKDGKSQAETFAAMTQQKKAGA